MQFIRSVVISLVIAFALGGCTTFYVPPKVDPEQPKFLGIKERLRDTSNVDLILIHGMCTQGEADWVAPASVKIADLLHLPITNIGAAIPLDSSGAALYPRVLTDGTKSVRLYAIVWSPITALAKQSLCFDASNGSGPCEPNRTANHRARVNSELKTSLVNDCLADAIFYAGPEGGKRIREAVKKGLAVAFSGGSPQADMEFRSATKESTSVFLVSESLGSKIVFDTLVELAQPASARTNVAKSISRITQVFLVANQIPILDLAFDPLHPPGSLDHSFTLARSFAGLREVANLYQISRGLGTANTNLLSIVAFTDPNDLLSYTLRNAPGIPTNLNLVDVRVSNASAVFGYMAHPLEVHKHYLKNPSVSGAIACGWSGLSGNCR